MLSPCFVLSFLSSFFKESPQKVVCKLPVYTSDYRDARFIINDIHFCMDQDTHVSVWGRPQER